MILVVVVVVLLVSSISSQTQLRIGVMGPTTDSYCKSSARVCLESQLGALTLAEHRARKEHLLDDVNVTYITADDGCKPDRGMAVATNLYEVKKIDVIFGSFCSPVLEPVGHYWTVKNIPALTHGATDPALKDKSVYRTLIRLGPTYSKYGRAFAAICEYYNWKRVAILAKNFHLCEFGASSINTYFSLNNLTVAEWIRVGRRAFTDAEIEDYLDRLYQRARIIIVCIDIADLNRLLIRASEKGMLDDGQMVFWGYSMLPMSADQPWGESYAAKPSPPSTRRLHQYYKLMTMAGMTGPVIDEFLDNVTAVMETNIWGKLAQKDVGRIYAVFLYEVAYLYFLLANETKSTQDLHNGTLMTLVARGKRFKGLNGMVSLDMNADREPDFELWQLRPDQADYTLFASLRIANLDQPEFTEVDEALWVSPNNGIPFDEPVCGWNDERCNKDDDMALVLIIVVCVLTVLAIIGVSLAKKYWLHQPHSWRITYEQLQFSVNNELQMESGASLVSSAVSTCSKATQEASKFFRGRLAQLNGSPTIVKHFKGHTSDVAPSKKDCIKLLRMREMTHENVNQFLGACPSAQNVCVCFLFCPKGSLDDLLANDEINLDKDFKTSLISDLISGMTYLHGSAVGCHGNLKSSTCLVDSRWVLKISMFGTRPFYVNDDHYEGDYARFKAQLWTSPELLRSASTRRDMLGGTQKGDVYSFAIILQEILFRSPPFFFDVEGVEPMDIIKRVKVGESPPFRPQLPSEGRGSFGQIAELMEHCWNEDPNVRPSFKKIKKMVKRSAGKNANLVDRMIQRLEKYATNLEDLVQARTAELESEKRKTDRLLYRMLPPSIAEGLKQGNSIEPEMFQSVTIYFSDIVHFTSLCSESSAVQVVTLLSDLYSLFDAIIADYDVYKVETIGDAYMVASGLPERNGNRHVAQIADMSLALLDAVIHKFTVRHMPGRRLKLRIGVHTGPCAAGVVGLTMPRYCLFGDTVNTASRMESNGEELKIHLSEEANEALAKHGNYSTSLRGRIPIKGKGEVTTYWLNCKL